MNDTEREVHDLFFWLGIPEVLFLVELPPDFPLLLFFVLVKSAHWDTQIQSRYQYSAEP